MYGPVVMILRFGGIRGKRVRMYRYVSGIIDVMRLRNGGRLGKLIKLMAALR